MINDNQPSDGHISTVDAIMLPLLPMKVASAI